MWVGACSRSAHNYGICSVCCPGVIKFGMLASLFFAVSSVHHAIIPEICHRAHGAHVSAGTGEDRVGFIGTPLIDRQRRFFRRYRSPSVADGPLVSTVLRPAIVVASCSDCGD